MAVSARTQLKKLMTATLADHANWTYREVRPLARSAPWTKGEKVTADCSKGVQFLCEWAGAPDPMGNGFSGYGNSQTIWLHLHHAQTAAELEAGDIVTFGTDGDQHAAMVMTPGADPVLWSFGHQGAPNTYKLSQDHRPSQYCKLPIKNPPPTEAQKLQAESTFYAWVAWRLGEGPWATYGKSNKKVRPNVPRVISMDWWRRYCRFLANRQRGNTATTG